MSLEPLTTPPRIRRFKTYDLEWWPSTYKVRLAGVFDGRTFTPYATIAEFLDGEITSANRGMTYFAHAGGTFDIQFLLAEILASRHDYQVEACFSGSAAVMVRIRKGGHRWIFADSYFLLRRPLREIAAWIGKKKGEKEEMLSRSMAVLTRYNEQDCRILYAAIDRLQRELLGLGGELRTTIASCAMALFRRVFLQTTIKTDDALNDNARMAYVASRVEVFERNCGRAHYYDINSSFPHSMSRPQPGNVREIRRRPPKDNRLSLNECDVLVRDCYLPPLAYRHSDNRIFFPTGEWHAWLDGADIEALEESKTGHIVRVHRSIEFEPFCELSDYVAQLYARKAAARDTFERELFKLLLNALYGKFAERSDKYRILIRPDKTTCPHSPRHENDTCMRIIMPGVWAIEDELNIPHAHVPISVHVTALSRALLWRYMHPCKRLYYCDTDSIVTTDKLESHPTKLGALKHEYDIVNGTFVQPKLYAFTTKDEQEKVKSKGFRQLSLSDFRSLVEGGEIEIDRMARIRESLSEGRGFEPHAVKGHGGRALKKRLRPEMTRPKRADAGGGKTRPWNVDELQERWKA